MGENDEDPHAGEAGEAGRERAAMALAAEALDLAEGKRAAFLASHSASEPVKARARQLLDLDKGAENGTGARLQTGGALGAEPLEAGDPERAGDYRIVGLVGRGGMGSVYLGERDTGDFAHTVAVKIVKPGLLGSTLADRFLRERQILAGLSHPNIARLFGGGVLEDGSPYLVMEYIGGEPLLVDAASRALGLDRRLDLFAQICRGVRHAHQNLVIHRDLTPSNILVDREGVAKLIDFGIARPEDEAVPDWETGSGQTPPTPVSYTPGYAAPERLAGARSNVLTDIFSLGRLLDELTEGCPGRGGDLDAIIAKAAAEDPADRYPSADRLLGDLTALRGNRPVDARGGATAYTLSKWLQRHWGKAAAGTVAALALAGGLVTTSALYREASRAQAAAEARFAETRELTGFLLTNVFEEAADLPGGGRVQADVIQTAERYIDVMRRAAADDPAVALDYARSLAALGNIQTGESGRFIGEADRGIAAFENALRLLNELQARPLADGLRPDVLELKVRTLLDLAGARHYHRIGSPEGVGLLREAKDALPQLAALRPAAAEQAEAKIGTLEFFYDTLGGSEADARRKEAVDLLEGDDTARRAGARQLSGLAAGQYNRWVRRHFFHVPDDEAADWEAALWRARTASDIAAAAERDRPGRVGPTYAAVYAHRIHALLLALDGPGEAGMVETVGRMRGAIAAGGPARAARLAAEDPSRAAKRERHALHAAALDEAERLLGELGAAERNTPDMLQARYRLHQARGHGALRLRFDLEEALAHAQAAEAVLRHQIKIHTVSSSRMIELANNQIEQAFALAAMSPGDPALAQEACRRLDEASALAVPLIEQGRGLAAGVLRVRAAQIGEPLGCGGS